MSPPPGWAPTLGWGTTVAVSGDGSYLAYVLESGTTSQLFLKKIDELEVHKVPGTRGARTPFFSPDGGWLGFYDEEGRQLKKVSLGGGEPLAIAPANDPWGAVWAEDDTIIYTSRYSGLMRVSAAGGPAEVVTTAGARQHMWPSLLPGDDVVLFTDLPARGSFDDAAIVAVPITGGEPEIIMESAYYPHYSPSGHLVFVQGNSVVAAPFDSSTLEVTGPAVTVLDDVWISSWIGYADFAFSETGTLIYVSGGPDRSRARLVWVDRQGGTVALLGQRRAFGGVRLHSGAEKLAVHILDKDADIWGYDLGRGQLSRLTGSSSWDAYPLWRPEADAVTFSSMRDGLAAIYEKELQTDSVTELIRGEHPMYPSSWSPDGRFLAYWEEHSDTGLDIWFYSAESGERTPFQVTRHAESAPEFSPDGSFLAYESNESGERIEVYVRPLPQLNPATRVSTAGGRSPRWRADGRELFYILDGTLMAVDVSTSGGFSAGTPRPLFTGSYRRHYDVTPNAETFLMIATMAEGDPPLHINLVSGWFDELNRRAPSGR
jgi:Tol biopolymer transport system component